jgi:3-hydroxybutyryl-CoA dehydratase
LSPFIVDCVDRARIKIASAILDDPNPIHYDIEQVRRLGLGEDVVNHGSLNLGYLANVALRFAGGAAGLRSFRGRFLGNVFAGERVECRGRVAEVDVERGEATLELTATVGDRQVMAAEAIVAVSTKGGVRRHRPSPGR